MIPFITITAMSFVLMMRNELTFAGRCVVFVLWLVLSWLFLSSSVIASDTPLPVPCETFTPVPPPTLSARDIRCTEFSLPDGRLATCCAWWRGNQWGQGTWVGLGCVR